MRGGSPLRRPFQAFRLAFLLAVWAIPSWAASPDEATGADATQRWAPAVGVIWGLFGQDSRASSTSNLLTGSSPPEPVRPPAAAGQPMFNPFVGASFELMSPRMFEGAGHPRVFAHIDLTAALGFSYDVSKEGDPGRVTQPVIAVPEAEVPGQGSVTEAQTGSAVFSSGAGFAFAVELGDWRLRIKPSLEYIREQIQVIGTLNRAVALPPPPPTPPPTATTDFRFIQLAGQKTRTFQGIGPGLEIEVDAARMDPFQVTVFVSGQAYALLGDRDIDFSDVQMDAFGSETAHWRFRPDEWLIRGSMGIRFRWLPKGGH